MSPTKAIEVISKHSKGVQGVWLCEDDGDIGDFSNSLLEAKIKTKDWDFFQDEYPRFLARAEGLGTGFQSDGNSALTSPIKFSLIYEVCDLIQDMPHDKKSQMLEQLKIYRVDRSD